MNTLTKLNKDDYHLNYITDYRAINFDDFKEYEYYRLVDPMKKEVFYIKDNQLKKFETEHCYGMWDTGEPCKYCVSASALESRCEKKKLEYLNGELHMARVIPVIFNNTILVLELFQNLSATYFRNEDKFEQISDMIKQLNELASLETFTNLYSHSYTKNKLSNFIDGTLKIERSTVTLVQLDINNLKHVNDTYGHTTGDELILKVAAIIAPLKNEENIFPGRTGGDEFQILLLNTSKEKSDEILQPYLEKLQQIPLSKTDYIASVSYGYLEWNKTDSAEEFTNRVDKLMYQNKRINKGLV